MLIVETKFRRILRFSVPEILLVFAVICFLMRILGIIKFFRSGVCCYRDGWTAWFFSAFFSYFWLLGWELVRDFFQKKHVCHRVFQVSFVSIVVCWLVALKWGESLKRSKPMILIFQGGIPTACVLLALLVFGLVVSICIASVTPLEAELHKRIRWGAHSNHAVHVTNALKRGCTYIGFETVSKQPVFLSEEGRSRHIQVLGSTGSGKTKGILLPMVYQDLMAGRGVLFVDAKGSAESLSKFYRLVCKAGREKQFNYFSLTDIDRSARYNPLQNGNASQLKDKIISTIEWTEPFYQRVCEDTLQSVFMRLDEIKRRVSLQGLSQLLRTPPSDLRFSRFFSERNRKNIETLTSEINLLTETPFGHLLDTTTPDIDLLDVYKNSKIVYFSLDAQSYSQTAVRLGKMITHDINTLSGLVASQFGPRERRVLSVTIDEFQSFGTKGFINALARGRESGLWITLAHQSLGDLSSINKAYCQQVIDLTNTKIFTHVNDPGTAQAFSEIVGTDKVIKSVQQTSIAGEQPKSIIANQRVAEEHRIQTNEVQRLEPGQAVFKSGREFGRLLLNDAFIANDLELILPPKAKSEPLVGKTHKEVHPKRKILL